MTLVIVLYLLGAISTIGNVLETDAPPVVQVVIVLFWPLAIFIVFLFAIAGWLISLTARQ